ncbi:N-acetylmuramoyl-L-alanine amidase family protein [Clostridium botulinum]|uniref:N-acetylmuramoyl-L-alanine amidase family protein n=1 Tax=Clostridium botulinum TaxID=1491 RepID=UPI0019672803|nr:N-acetylmuramoyl-L-alanine amidase family protein [Clostridium botulinum]MBN1075602.1 N-acetylmuramoyl-L-alanine amidase family protein [Clostridium botulinum]
MFNRANKMTALLVAAAAVVSLVPATGVNAAEVKRIGSEDGKVYHAVAYKDGHFYVDGEVNDKDEAAYYLADGKYSELEDVDSNSAAKSYGEKYVNIEGGDYFVDLSNGKVTDEDVRENDIDDAASALRKKIKDDTDDRYKESDANTTRDDAEKTKKASDLSIVSGSKFGETWYETEVTRADNCKSNGNQNFTVYTDAKGKYIDADHNIGTIKVKVEEDATTSSAVTLENTDKEYKVGENTKVKATIENSITLGQDSKNIYRYATLKLEVKGKYNASGNDAGTIVSVNGKTGVDTTSIPVIQKISKEQASGDIDGAKYAKSVSTYMVSDDKARFENNDEAKKDVKDFAKLLEEFDGSSIVNGKVVLYKTQGTTKGEVVTQVASLKTSAGWYYLDAEGQSKEDIDYNEDNEVYSLDVDVDGNIWRMDSGFVYKFDNTDDWDKTYKVDGSMDRLSVYNKDNMVVWNEKDEVYSVIGAKEDKEEEKPEVEVKAGWNQAADGTWTFVKADGIKATGWLQDGANWYLLNEAGIMQTGWQTVGGTWYYLAGNGAMQTGWQNINGAWYFLQGSGAMQTGWINDNGTWYFADGSGKMLANTTVNGYVLGANGAWVK